MVEVFHQQCDRFGHGKQTENVTEMRWRNDKCSAWNTDFVYYFCDHIGKAVWTIQDNQLQLYLVRSNPFHFDVLFVQSNVIVIDTIDNKRIEPERFQ